MSLNAGMFKIYIVYVSKLIMLSYSRNRGLNLQESLLSAKVEV